MSTQIIPEQSLILSQLAVWIDQKNLCPATSGNLSTKIDNQQFLISVSGKQKGELGIDDFVRIHYEIESNHLITTTTSSVLSRKHLNVLDDKKPSAETWIHAILYHLDPEIKYILHTHSAYATVLSRHTPEKQLQFEGYEMQKALTGVSTHEGKVSIHIFDNTQDMPALAEDIAYRWKQNPLCWGFLVRGHGLYAWGRSESEVKRHVEGIEFLMQCRLLESQYQVFERKSV